MRRYQIIYADPPWLYRDQCVSGQRGAGYKYPCATLDDLKRIPVSNLADKNAVMVMWATWPQLPEALDLMQAWGFQYKTCGFVWLKRNMRYYENLAMTLRRMFRHSDRASDLSAVRVRELLTEKEMFMGMGAAGTRANSEFCLIGKRGKLSRLNKGVAQVVETLVEEPETWAVPHTGSHSEKPAIFRDRIEHLFGDLDRVELFCRHSLDEWSTWGNESGIDYDICMEDYEEKEVLHAIG